VLKWLRSVLAHESPPPSPPGQAKQVTVDPPLRLKAQAVSTEPDPSPARRRDRPRKAPAIPLDADAQPHNAYNHARRSDRSASELIGIARGVLADGVVTEGEFDLLVGWLEANPDALYCYPGSILLKRVQRILAHRRVDPEELEDIAELLRELIGASQHEVHRYMRTLSTPVGLQSMSWSKLQNSLDHWRYAVVRIGMSLCVIIGTGGDEVEGQTVVTGIVLDAETRTPLGSTTIIQADDTAAFGRAEADEDGVFSLQLRGPPPYVLYVERIGYAPRRISADASSQWGRRLEVLLWRDPLVLPGIAAEVELSAEEAKWFGFSVTNVGLTHYRHAEQCYYLAMNDVVIRDPRLFNREAAARTEPGRIVVTGRSIGVAIVDHRQAFGSRVRRDAWPCGVIVVVRTSPPGSYSRRRAPSVSAEIDFHRDLPRRDAPRHELSEQGKVIIPGQPLQEPRVVIRHAASPTAIIARAAMHDGRPVIELSGDSDIGGSEIGHGETGRRVIDLSEAPTRFSLITDFGWLGDTLWVTDATTRRIARFAPGAAEPIVREYSPAAASAPAGPPELIALELPRPLADGRWLINQALPDAVYPRRPEDPPSTRHLFALDSTWTRRDMLGVLRPAPEPLVLGLADLVQPLRDHVIYAVAPGGDHVTIVRRGTDMAMLWSVYSVQRVDLRGNTIFHVERTAPLVRVSDRAFEALTDELVEHPALAREFPSAAARRTLVRGGLFRPASYYAPISDVVAGEDGTTWLRWPDDGSRTVRWDVLDAAGQPLRTLDVDRAIHIVAAAGETVWALGRSDAGEWELARFTLSPR
jgi:hypothetical protein